MAARGRRTGHRAAARALGLTTMFLLVATLATVKRAILPDPAVESAAAAVGSVAAASGSSARHLLQAEGGAWGDLSADPANEHYNWTTVPCLKFSERNDTCYFVTHADACQIDGGFINYLELPFCWLKSEVPALGLMFLWLVLLFILLGLTAEEFFCPALSVISDTLKLSHNVAGVTFLALGNGAPDIFSVFSAITHTKNGAALALGELFGSGVFVTSIVVGTVAFLVPFKVTRRPFIRDVFTYLIATAWTYGVLIDNKIYLVEAIGFVVLYVAYVLVVVIGRKIYQSRKKKTVDPLEERAARAKEEEMASLFPPAAAVASRSRSGSTRSHTLADALTLGEGLGAAVGAGGVAGMPKANTLQVPDMLNPRARTASNGSDNPYTASESTMLLGSRTDVLERPGPWTELFRELNPIDVEEFMETAWYWKVYHILKAPFHVLLVATVPVVDYDEEDQRWRRYVKVMNCLVGPLFFVFGANVAFLSIGGVVPIWLVALCVSLFLAILVWAMTENDAPPKYHNVFAFFGFLQAVIWIYMSANEIVNLLQAFGRIMGIGDAILGLTVLAWGNSIGDFVSDVTVARQGFPQMAVGACFGGPALNMLIGVGLSCSVQCLKSDPYVIGDVGFTQLLVSGAFLLLSQLSSLIYVPTCAGFTMGKRYGIFLCILYLAFMVISVTLEFVDVKVKV